MYRQSENLLNSNISSTCPHNMANFGPLAAEIGLLVWSTPANFSGFRLLASLLHRHRSTKVNHTLHDVCLSAGLDTIYTFQGLLLSNRILSGAKFTFRPSRSFSYIGSVTARHSSTGRQPNFAVFSRRRHLYIRQGGHHVGHRPTF